MYIITNIKRFLLTFSPNQIVNYSNSKIFLEAQNLNKTLLSRLDDIIDIHTNMYDPEIFSNGSDHRWYDIKKQNPSFFDEILSKSGVLEIIKNELNDFEYIVLYNHIRSVNENTGSGDGYHIDSTRFQRKLIYYLTDADTNNGCFQYIPETSKLSFIRKHILRNLFSNNIFRFHERYLKNLKKINVIKEKGNGFLVQTSMVHRGNPLINGERRAITFYMFPKNNFPKQLNKYI